MGLMSINIHAYGRYAHAWRQWAWVYEVGFIQDINLNACVQRAEHYRSNLVWKDIHDRVALT